MERGSFLWKRMIGQGVDVPISRLILAIFMNSHLTEKKKIENNQADCFGFEIGLENREVEEFF
jgi:hypothetical protein